MTSTPRTLTLPPPPVFLPFTAGEERAAMVHAILDQLRAAGFRVDERRLAEGFEEGDDASTFLMPRSETTHHVDGFTTYRQWDAEFEDVSQDMQTPTARMSFLSGPQPIETAPLDGSWILLMGGETDESFYTLDHQPAYAGRPVTAHWDGGYWCVAYWDGSWRTTYSNPTHWMPVPLAEGMRVR